MAYYQQNDYKPLVGLGLLGAAVLWLNRSHAAPPPPPPLPPTPPRPSPPGGTVTTVSNPPSAASQCPGGYTHDPYFGVCVSASPNGEFGDDNGGINDTNT